MISVAEARSFVLSAVVPLPPRSVPVADAWQCVVAEEIRAREPVPRFVNSSMDGFAVRAADVASDGVHLRVVEAVLAGDVAAHALGPGEAARIMTGAPLPDGADSVAIIEDAIVDPATSTVQLRRAVTHGEFVRHPGDDVTVGDVLVVPGDVLHPTRLGVLASQGLATVVVHPRPRVGVLSTGNELTDSLGTLAPGQIRDVNRPLLLALLRNADVDAVDLGVVRDDFDGIVDALSTAATRCDAVITTGGVSVGDADFVKGAIGRLGGDHARSLSVAVRPGKPFAFGVIGPDAVPVFGLPGNPVSTRVSFELFVRPALRRRAGYLTLDRLTLDAVLDVAMPRSRDGRDHMVHVVVRLGADGRAHVIQSTREGSHLLHAVAFANALACVPDGDGFDVGASVRVSVLQPETLTAP